MTIKIDQIADAIVATPGDLINVTDGVPSSNIEINSTSDILVMPESGSLSFTAKFNGQYAITFSGEMIAPSSNSSAQFKLVFDEGTSAEQTVGYTEKWQTNPTTGNYTEPVFRDVVTLTSGEHTVKAYGKRLDGSGVRIPSDLVHPLQLTLQAIMGSGAGGTLVDYSEKTSDQTISSLDTDTKITELDLSVDVSEGESLFIHYQISSDTGSSSVNTRQLLIRVDGGSWTGVELEAGSYRFTHTGTYLLTDLSAGTHTIEFGYRNSSPASTLWGDTLHFGHYFPCRVWAIRYRGGLVPIRQDGVDIVGQPRAFNFIGGGVYEVTEGSGANAGVANIELNQAVTAVGDFIKVSSPQQTADISLTTSDTLITGPHSFEAKVSGTYNVIAGVTFVAPSVGTAHCKLVFDEGEPTEQSIGYDDDDTWSVRVNSSQFGSPSFVGQVVLTAGTHTVKFYAKEDATYGGSIEIQGTSTRPNQAPFVALQAVIGSGAGGTLLDAKVKSGGDQVITTGSWQKITGLEHSFTASPDEEVSLCTAIYFHNASASTCGLAYSLDGGTTLVMFAVKYIQWSGEFTADIPIAGLSGSQTLEIYGYAENANMTIRGGTSTQWGEDYESKSWIRQYRGGLVPIRNDSVTVVDKPAAIDFVGPNVQVTNNGGTATVNFNGVAGGMLVEETTLSSTFTTSSSSFVDIDNGGGDALEVTVTVVEGERLMLMLAGEAVHSGGANRLDIQYLVDSTSYPTSRQGESNASGYTSALGSYSPVVTGALSSGSVTVKAQTAASSSSSQILAGARLQVIRFRGGYTQPENVPVISGVDGYLFNYISAPGAADDLRLLMNDGVRYKAVSPLQMDINSTGLGGRETSASLSDGTWYYNYAVPDPDNAGYFNIIASDQHPGLGPADYNAWRYLGAVYYIDSTDRLRKVTQVGNKFDYPDALDETTWIYDSGSGGTSEVTPTANVWTSFSISGAGPGGGLQKDLRDTVPVSAVQADFSASMDTDGGEIYDLLIESGEVQYTPTASSATPGAFLSCDTSQRQTNRALVPLHNRDAYFRWATQNTGGVSWLVSTRGYVDGYLSNLESQKQALYIPDSLLPRLTWIGDSEVSIAAAPAQPSVVKLTLQDEKERSFNGTLTFDPSLGAADGGLDTGSEASDTWYYLYLVPKSGDDDFLTVRGSDNPPYTGPSGYSNYRYIGAVYNNSSSNILKAYQLDDNRFMWSSYKTLESDAGPFDDGSAVAVDVSDEIPNSASAIFTSVKVYNASGLCVVDLWADGDEDTSPSLYRFWASGEDECAVPPAIPTRTSNRQVWRKRDNQSGTSTYWEFHCTGWVDGYLGQASDAGNAHYGATNLNQAYEGGRTITIDSGPVFINANGGDALELDGYLILGEIVNPGKLSDASIAYAKDVDGYSELHVIDNFGNVTQITRYGHVYTLLPSYAVGLLPSASPAGQMIYVYDESGGAVTAFSDGTNWRRTTDRNIVS